jgi:hypothetical protein
VLIEQEASKTDEGGELAWGGGQNWNVSDYATKLESELSITLQRKRPATKPRSKLEGYSHAGSELTYADLKVTG